MTKKQDTTIDLTEVFQAIDSLEADEGVPKSVKSKMDNIRNVLNSSVELSEKLSKCLADLDELSEDINIPSYIRTHIWNISGILEKFNR